MNYLDAITFLLEKILTPTQFESIKIVEDSTIQNLVCMIKIRDPPADKNPYIHIYNYFGNYSAQMLDLDSVTGQKIPVSKKLSASGSFEILQKVLPTLISVLD